MFYGGTMAALIVMRYTQKDAYRPYKVCWHDCSTGYMLL
jgi:hypothetical protein